MKANRILRAASRASFGTAALAAALFLGGPAWADQKDDKEKAEEEWKEAEERQGKEGEQPGLPGIGENPLEEILELMNEVENRLVEADTGAFTQDEQKKIVEAMRFEDKTSAALEELIKKVEEEQQKQQQQSQSQSSQDQQQQKQQQQKQQQKDREQQEREREQERQRHAQEQKQQEQQRQDQQTAEQQRREQGTPPEGGDGPLGEGGGTAERWGNLPAKLHQDAANASNKPAPGRWSELIKRYRARLAESDGSD